ncbi:MAG TPA: phasin family protein [Roseiarcus sp.]|nr:phasin family protein [Xanthobacteraceae bacterium]HME84984.1 phasin family protein [Roseiarcus sp.]
MADPTIEEIAKTNAENLARSGQAAAQVMKGGAEAMTESRAASTAALQELTRAYQEMAIKNAKNLTAAMEALAKVKSPSELIALQQRLMREGVEAAISESQTIARLTSAMFAAAFEPMRKQIEAAQKTTQG